jgi:hypothetical protein
MPWYPSQGARGRLQMRRGPGWPSRRNLLRLSITVSVALLALAVLPSPGASPRVAPGEIAASAGSAPAPATAAVPVPDRAVVPSHGGVYWENLSAESSAAPSPRAFAYEAYYPPLNATLLWGGYYGFGGNYAFNDLWEFSNNSWTELNSSGGPSPRSSGAMVYDAADHYLLLFGGRSATQEYNDTWAYNASGWTNLSLRHAPSARDGSGMVYDAAANEVVLFGGRKGNLPAGEGYPDTFYNDTWTYHAGVWTNVTATAGIAPPAEYRFGQMVYDAGDGYVLLDGGINQNVANDNGCGLLDGSVWTFAGGQWSRSAPTSPAPPAGRGDLWFDRELNRTLYYEGQENVTGSCAQYGNEVWSYSAGGWTLLTSGGASAPLARANVVIVDDQASQEQIMFGGSGPEYAQYLGDTWEFFPTGNAPRTYPVNFTETGLPLGTRWNVAVGTTSYGYNSTIGFYLVNGTYAYRVGNVPGFTRTPGSGLVTVNGAGVSVSVVFSLVTYEVTFRETGLPAGHVWSLVEAGFLPNYFNSSNLPTGNRSFLTSSPSVSWSQPNGSFSYLLQSGGAFRVVGVSPEGNLTVDGSALTVTFGFVRGATFTLTASETGLRLGRSWCMTLVLPVCSTTSRIEIRHLTPSVYDYSFRDVGPLTPGVRLHGTALGSTGVLAVAYSVALKVVFGFAVYFEQFGLPYLSLWAVQVDGVREIAESPYFYFVLANGTYHFSVPPVPGYQPAPFAGEFVVVGTEQVILIDFVRLP